MNSKSDMVYNLWVLLMQTRDAIYNARHDELRQYGMSSREAGTLYAIYSIGEKTTPAKITRWLYRKPHTIAGMLMRMQKKGLIKRSKDLEAKNAIRISLSEEGKQAYNKTLDRKSLLRIFNTLTDEERDNMHVYLMKIRDVALKETGDTIYRPLTSGAFRDLVVPLPKLLSPHPYVCPTPTFLIHRTSIALLRFAQILWNRHQFSYCQKHLLL